jgi:adenosylcobinamide-phosphate synthase
MVSLVTSLAFILDWILGDPQSWPHPVRFLGRLIAKGEDIARDWAADRPKYLRQAGTMLAVSVVLISMGTAYILLTLAAHLAFFLGCLAATYLVYSALCLKDLYQQTWQVEMALKADDLDLARQRLAWVVGRDTDKLDEAAIRRAVIETLAENLSDGLVAPLFYLALGGPVLAWGYKAVNTLDSMIGYKNDRYIDLGRFAAKLDDAANYIPARLTALLLLAAARILGHNWQEAQRVWQRDGGLHSSPNSGQPEAAMAGALGLCLGGPSYYGGILSDKPFINEGGAEAGPDSLRSAERMMLWAAVLMLALCLFTISVLTGTWGWLI